jgi:zinc transport system substrate-binding protein
MQLASLSESNLYFQMGYTGFEMAWLDKMVSSNPSMPVVNLSEGIELIHETAAHDHSHQGHHHGGIDPHIWMSPRNVKVIAANIYDALAAAIPADAEIFKANLENFQREIDSLDAWIQSELSGLTSRSFFIYHPALSYFSRDYGLNQHPMELGGKEPSPAHLKHLVDLGSEENIGVIFLQMQFDQKNAETLANEIDAEIVQINPLDPEWHKSMRLITTKLKENLQ